MRKSQREQLVGVTTFLHGCRKNEIMQLLGTRGFTAQERAKGGQLLVAFLSEQAQEEPTSEEGKQKSLLRQLDLWENDWFPIADVILSQYYPTLHKRIFHNLSQKQGLHVIFSVSTFLLRVEQLAQASGDEEKAAFAHLESRGLNTEERQRAKALLTDLLGLESFPTEEKILQQLTEQKTPSLAHLADEKESLSKTPQDDEAAEEDETTEEAEESDEPTTPQTQAAFDALARWYREWSLIARKVITRKDHLIALGLRQRAPSKKNTI
jgi:hypothetical protein